MQVASSSSRLEPPVSPGVRVLKIVVVLVLDAAMLGTGIALIHSYLEGKRAPAPTSQVVDVMEPRRTGAAERRPPKRDDPARDHRAAPAAPGQDRAKEETRRTQSDGHRGARSPVRNEPEPNPGIKKAEPDQPVAERPGQGKSPAGDPTTEDVGSGDDSAAVPPALGPDPWADAEPDPWPDDRGEAPSDVAPEGAPGDLEPDPSPQGAPDEAVDELARQIAREVERNRSALTRCYERAAKGHGPADPLQGRVELALTVYGDGVAENIREVRNDTGSDVLSRCLMSSVASWRFPRHPYEPIDLVWPFMFHPPN